MREIISRLETFYVDVPALRPGTTGAYLLAFVSVVVATALRLAIDPFVGGLQFATFFPAVIVTTLISGLGAGLLSVVLSLGATAFFVLPPRLSLYVEQPADVLAIVLYAVAMFFNVAVIAGLRVAVERQRALQAVQTTKDRLQFALDAALLGWWQYDPTRGVVWGDPRLKEMLEIPEDWPNIEEFKKRVHPDDQEKVWAAMGAAIDPTNPKPYAIEFRHRREDGEVRWIEAHAHVQFEGSGRERRAVSMVGTGQDITKRKQQEENERLLMREVHHRATLLEESKDRLQFALDSALLGWWQYDPIHGVVWWNPRSKELFEIAEDWTGIEEFNKRVHPDDIGRVWVAIGAAIDPTNPKPYAIEFRHRRQAGGFRWIEVHAHVQFEGSGRERRAVNMVGTAQDITDRKQGEEERKHHEELLQRQADLLNQSHDAILMMRTDGRAIVYWSRGAERLYGYTATEAEGGRAHELLQTRAPIPIEDIEMQVVHRGSWNGELTHTTREGREIVVESSIVRVSYNGETFALETNRDITERKRHEEREHLIMREMGHRAKNMLGLVQAIARQTATRNPEEFIARFSERIEALSANQELLVKGEWKGIETEDLVRAQLAPFAGVIGTRIATHGPKLRLKAAGAQAIGLALHELATNAGKYGALSNDAGRVDIRWGTEDETFTMSWTERGGPPVSAPNRQGFGTTVMKTMAESSVEGTVDVDYAPAGLTWRLTCSAESILEPRERSSSTLWDRTAILERFSMARRHVAMGERNIARQREIVAELERHGHDSLDSKRLLGYFEELQNMHIAHRDRLEKTLGEISK